MRKFVIYGTDEHSKPIVKKEFKLMGDRKVSDLKKFRDKILADNEEVIDVFVAEVDEQGNEKPMDIYTITRPGHEYDGIRDESLKESVKASKEICGLFNKKESCSKKLKEGYHADVLQDLIERAQG